MTAQAIKASNIFIGMLDLFVNWQSQDL